MSLPYIQIHLKWTVPQTVKFRLAYFILPGDKLVQLNAGAVAIVTKLHQSTGKKVAHLLFLL